MEPTPNASCSASIVGDDHKPSLDSSSPSDILPSMSLPDGIYVPMVAFFKPGSNSGDDSAEIDLPATQRHTARLLHAGVTGLVVHGSNGEAVHLSRAERTAIIGAVADTLRHEAAEHAHGHGIPLIAGCSAASVAETVQLCREAHSAGATHALVLPPAYYRALLDADALVRFFAAVANASPLPLLVYNFPAAAGGLDLDSDVLVRIAAAHRRVVGAKLTCGNTGKLARVVAQTARFRSDFFVAGGSADFILPGLAVGARASIAGLANLAPRACVRAVELWAQKGDEARGEARRLQATLAGADWLAIRYGFRGIKAAMPMFHGEGERDVASVLRLPFVPLEPGGREVREIEEGMADLMEVEAALAKAQAA